MFCKKIKNIFLLILLSFYIIPFSIKAYSEYVIVSGENIGIKLNTDGVIIVGTYTVNGQNSSEKAGLKVGDTIISINDNKITNINEMIKQINNSRNKMVKIGYIHNNEEKTTNLELYNDNGTYKTGLYVKDTISGIGTLTYIDPKTKLFGALGHEITDSTTGKILEIKDGTIFDSTVTGVTPSTDGDPGEKNATFNSDNAFGTIYENTNKGIFGKYNQELDSYNYYKVATIKDIKLGEAKILTVLDGNKISEYTINVLKVSDTKDNVKNIIFEITDKDLLKKTNGIIQGMSGSPIIQGDYIIGAVTHVVVDNPHKGYGIFITNMLEEAEN